MGARPAELHAEDEGPEGFGPGAGEAVEEFEAALVGLGVLDAGGFAEEAGPVGPGDDKLAGVFVGRFFVWGVLRTAQNFRYGSLVGEGEEI